jgi:hypothetical protein
MIHHHLKMSIVRQKQELESREGASDMKWKEKERKREKREKRKEKTLPSGVFDARGQATIGEEKETS